MTAGPLAPVLRHIHLLAGVNEARALSDAQLLARFAARRDEASFGVLIERYGALVLSVSRRLLALHEAEDVFQAVFLVLAQRAATIRRGEALAGWLHRVAWRVARSARGQHGPGAVLLPEIADEPRHGPAHEASRRELCALIEEEIQRLPEKYRLPVVLCYCQGKTYDEAASELRWPRGTVAGRLHRAREQLQRRLARRGVTLPAATLATLLASEAVAAVPAALAGTTVRLASLFAAGTSSVPAASPVVVLAQRGLSALAAARRKLLWGLVAMLGLLLTGVGTVAQVFAPAAPPEARQSAVPATSPRQPAPAAKQRPLVDRYGDPLPPGAIARIGTVRLQHGDGISCLAFSRDGKTLASGSSESVRLWDAATGREKHRFPCDVLRCRCVVFLPDGKTLASVGAEFVVRFWDIDNGKEVRRLSLQPQSFGDPVISPDGKTVACGGQDLSLWDLTNKGGLRKVNRGGLFACFVAFSPDSKKVAVIWSDGGVRLHDAATGKETGQRLEKVDTNLVASLAISPDGKLLALPAENNSVRLWEIDTGKKRPLLEGFRKPVYAVAFAPDGKTLASGGWDEDEPVCLWDVATGKEVRPCKGRSDYLSCLAFTADGKTLAGVGFRNRIQLWDTATGEPRRVAAEPPDGLRRVHFLPDGKTLISAGGSPPPPYDDDHSVHLWEAATGKELRSFSAKAGDVYQLALTPNGEKAALIAFAPERKRGRQQGWVSLHRVATGKELFRLKMYANALAFTPDGRTLLLSCGEEGVRLYQTSTGKEVRQLKCGKTGLSTLAVSPDGTMLAAGGDERRDGKGPSWNPTVWLWDLASGKERRRLRFPHRLPNSSLHALAFSPDSRLLATAIQGWSGRTSLCVVQLWDAATGKELRRLEEENRGSPTITFSPDGRTLAVGDKSLLLWEVATGKKRRQLRGHDGVTTAVDFSPDGRLLASSSRDRTVLVWDLSAEARAGAPAAPLSAAELQRHWDALAGDDAAQAYQAVRVLAASPRQTVALLRQRLRPVPSADPARLARLIRDLDSGRFSVRQQAAKELEQQGDVALPALRQATRGKPALETRRRLDRLIERAEGWTPERLQAWRALEVLEAIGTPEACQLLQALARGARESRQTQEALASLQRLTR